MSKNKTTATILAVSVLLSGCLEPIPPSITDISDTKVEVSAFSNFGVYPTVDAIDEKANQGCSMYGKQPVYLDNHCSSHDIDTTIFCNDRGYCHTTTSSTCKTVTYLFSCIQPTTQWREIKAEYADDMKRACQQETEYVEDCLLRSWPIFQTHTEIICAVPVGEEALLPSGATWIKAPFEAEICAKLERENTQADTSDKDSS